MRDSARWRLWVACLGAVVLLIEGIACNEHALNPFGSTVKVAKVEVTDNPETRTVDILFIVDNSNSMCEEQQRLQENFDRFIEILAAANADFRLAVVNTDMTFVNPESTTAPGQFQIAPGTYKTTGACSATQAQLEEFGRIRTACLAREAEFMAGNRYLSSSNYLNPETGKLDVQRVKDDFSCLALTGVDGYGIEMGLATAKRALELEGQDKFLRERSLLALVFVTDENDCSDGTLAFQGGGVVGTPGSEGAGNRCEWLRNIEDSCTLAAGDMLVPNADSSAFTLQTYWGEDLTFEGETKPARQWCIEGNREALKAFQAAGETIIIGAQQFPLVDCPDGECANMLIHRQEYFDFFVKYVAERNKRYYDRNATDSSPLNLERALQDIVIAVIINRDEGWRYADGTPLDEDWCGPAGTQGYRYQYFAEMFPDDRRVYAPICCKESFRPFCSIGGGEPSEFAQALRVIAERIGEALNSVCLSSRPFTCQKNGPTVCPEGQTCSQCYFEGRENEYCVCSGFSVRVEFLHEDGTLESLVQGDEQRSGDYNVNLSSNFCLNQTGSPIQLNLVRSPPPGSRLLVQYARDVAAVDD